MKTADNLKQYIEKLATDLYNVRPSVVMLWLTSAAGELTGVTSAVSTD